MVHISQFYPCTNIVSGIELYYIAELGKYLKYNYSEQLSLDGVIISGVVKVSKFFDYFRLACDEGWVVNTGFDSFVLEINAQNPLLYSQDKILNALFVEDYVPFDSEEHRKRQLDLEWSYRNPIKKTISFAQKEDKLWIWNIGGKDGKAYSENKANVASAHSSMAIVSLVAKVAVDRLMTGVPTYFAIGFSHEHCQTSMSLSLFDAMQEVSDAFNGWVIVAYDDNVSEEQKNNLSYQAWYAIGKEKGMLSRWYTAKEKIKYAKSLGIDVGAVVCLYERPKAQHNNLIKTISNCNMAIVREINNDGVVLEVIHTTKPYAQGKRDFDNNTMAVKAMYAGKLPYADVNTSTRMLDWTSLGVEYMLYTELFFITPIDNNDAQTRYVGRGTTLTMGACDLVYWIIKDYGLSFDEELFLSTYFKDGSEPLYTRFQNRESLSEFEVKQGG